MAQLVECETGGLRVACSRLTGVILWECGGSVVECLTRDRRAAGSSLTDVTALWSLSKAHLS